MDSGHFQQAVVTIDKLPLKAATAKEGMALLSGHARTDGAIKAIRDGSGKAIRVNSRILYMLTLDSDALMITSARATNDRQTHSRVKEPEPFW